MPLCDIAVVGASAGGVEALQELAAALPAGHAGAVLVVLHVMPGGTSVLGDILDRAGPLRAAAAEDGEPVEHGRIYVAPPNRHLLVRDGALILARDKPEQGHRPAVDPLFRSAAAAHGARVAGVVLSGTGDDGSAGLRAVADAGGLAFVERADAAKFGGMPEAALRAVPSAATGTPAEIAGRLCEAALPAKRAAEECRVGG